MGDLRHFLIQSVPDKIDTGLLLAGLGNLPFITYHDLFTGSTIIITESGRLDERFSNIGISVKEMDMNIEFGSDLIHLQIMAKEEQKRYDPNREESQTNEIYRLFKCRTKAFTAFYPASQQYLNSMKDDIEDRISRMEVRATKSMPAGTISSNRDSVHSDLYYGSGQKKLLLSMLENVNESMISRGVSYKVSMIMENNEHSQDIIAYIKSKTVVLKAGTIKANDVNSLHHIMKDLNGVPLPYQNASRLLWISGRTMHNAQISTSRPRSSGEISIGSYLDSAITDTGEEVGIERCIFNLGTIITGVPGTGKTMVAKHILSQFPNRDNKSIVIISPTAEWNGFCSEFSIKTIDMSSSSLRLNFFRCEGGSPQKFYEDLALLIASASNAGPYRNAIEKCLLSAFKKVYSRSADPDPADVYSEIEDAIIDQHAKRTTSSIKYTKHGENIKSSLENLRLVLMKPQFAYSGGMSFRELVKNGTVFDLSNISNSMKPLFYAFILNQVYSITDEFDTKGDNELRSIICVEEAHLIFGGEEDSAATMDLRQRIQNFRKKGIGLFLITHNVTDINPGIRRLCQIKMYFRQSPDTAKYASNDMIFAEDDYIKATGMFKTLGQRICALSYIETTKGEKVPVNSMLVKIPRYTEARVAAVEHETPAINKDTAVFIKDAEGQKEYNAELYYLNEKMHIINLKGNSLVIQNLLQGKRYKLIMLGERKRDNREFTIIGGSENTITLQAEAK